MINYSINKPCNYPVDYNGTEEVVYPANTIPIPTPLSIKYGDNPVQDDEFLYRQTAKGVHAGEETSKAVAQLDTIKGKSLVWNQINQNGNFVNEKNGYYVSRCTWVVTDNVAVLTQESDAYNGFEIYSSGSLAVSFITGRKYYISFFGKGNKPFRLQLAAPINKIIDVNTANTWVKLSCIGTASTNFLDIVFTNMTGGNNIGYVKNIKVIDLTLMFGAGNEPATVEEFEKIFPLDYYDYNAGEIIGNTAEYIESVGFNQWDEQWEKGSYNTTTGAKTTGDNVRNKTKIAVFPNTTYYGGFNISNPFCYNNNGDYIGQVTISSGTFTTPSDCAYICFRTNRSYGDTYKNDICINISDEDRNGTYEPYEKHTLPLDPSQWRDKQGNLVFPYGGMHGVGNAYDYAEVDADGCIRRAVRCLNQVDLGTLTWEKRTVSGTQFFASTFPNAKITNISNAICSKYILDRRQPNFMQDKSFNIQYWTLDQAINILDSSYTDTTTFKAAMQGVPLIYELKTPVEVELATPIKVLKDRRIGDAPVGRVYIGTDKVWETEDWYGIKWTEDNSVSTDYIQRIGNPILHQTLPLLSMMRRCMVQDDGTVYKYISDTNPLQYEDGTTANYDGTDGQVMVEIPAYHHESYQATENGVVWNYLKLYPNVKLGVTSPKCYYGAFEMMQDNSNNSTAKGSSVSILDLTTMGVDSSTTSINATDVKYISGKLNYRNYDYANTDTTSVKCSYGRATTNRDRATFRTIAANRGTRWSQRSWDAYCSLLRLYAVEYCNFDAQLAFNPNTTAEGYKQGGLGAGVTTTDSATWNSFNAYHSFVPCGTTISLGNKTGNISYVFAANEFSSSAITFSVPSYRGIENPFGHIWEFIDGFNRMGVTGNKENIYVCHDVTKFAENAATGYELISNTAARATGDIAGISWDKSGTFWPKPGGRTIYGDYFYNAYANNTWYTLSAGGHTISGAEAGLLYLYGSDAAAYASAAFGSRLLYTPSEN